MIFDEFLGEVKKGMSGQNKGLSMGYPKLEKYLYGIQKHRYDVVFAEDGVGKSSFVLNAYILNPFMDSLANNKKLKILFFSLEVSKVNVIGKLVSLYIYQKHNIIIDSAKLFSRGDNLLTKKEYELVEDCKSFFEQLFEVLTILDKPCKPTDILNTVNDYASTIGILKRNSKGDSYFIENDESLTTIVIIDTVGNLLLEANGGLTSAKGTIDLHSSHCVNYYRNLYNFCVVNVSHANRSISSTDRVKFGEVFPKKSDIKETNMLAQDANTVMCLFNPHDHANENNKLGAFMGYKIGMLKERFRALGLLKNRSGSANKRIGMLYVGEVGLFKELPKSTDMKDTDYLKINSI